MHTKVAELIDVWLPKYARDRKMKFDASSVQTLRWISDRALKQAVNSLWFNPVGAMLKQAKTLKLKASSSKDSSKGTFAHA